MQNASAGKLSLDEETDRRNLVSAENFDPHHRRRADIVYTLLMKVAVRIRVQNSPTQGHAVIETPMAGVRKFMTVEGSTDFHLSIRS